MKMKFRAVILVLNYVAAVGISLTILVSEQLAFGEKAIYGTGAILVGMAIRNLVKAMIPAE